MKKVLITGGAGFIGSNLINSLEGSEIVVIDNLHHQIHGNPETSRSYLSIKEKCTLIKGDVSEYSTWKKLRGEKWDSIYLLAAETGTGQSMIESYKHVKTNVLSVSILNDLMTRNEMRADNVILASSRAIYGNAKLDENGNPIASREEDTPRPSSVYAATKLSQENLCQLGFRDSSVTILRLQNVYGPGQSLINPYTGILSIFLSAIRNEKDINVFSDGRMSRDFVYIDDVISALLRAGASTGREIYNVGSGRSVSVMEVAEALINLSSTSTKITITGEELTGDIRHNLADLNKAHRWGYFPKIFFSEGCKKFFEWALESEIESSQYHNSLSLLREKGFLKKS
jgi:dTDP-L-rhamnose 4-epimerase